MGIRGAPVTASNPQLRFTSLLSRGRHWQLLSEASVAVTHMSARIACKQGRAS